MDRLAEKRPTRDALGCQPAVESLELSPMQCLLRVQHRFDSVEPLWELTTGPGM